MAASSLAELRARRAFECRLDPARALRSLDDAADFLADRGILTRAADCALPSLFEACHQPPYRAGGRGFAGWPEMAWPWFAQLAEREDVVQLSAHGGKRVLMTRAVARLADPLCRAGLAAAEADGADPAALLAHLAAAGPSHLDDLKLELGWDAARLRRARGRLERTGAVVSRGVIEPAAGAGHTHTSMLQRWDQLFPEPAAEGSADALVVACVRAAVLAPESEPPGWFAFVSGPRAADVGRLVDESRLRRPAPGWLTWRISPGCARRRRTR
jgi:hypothetical protein